MPLTTSKLPKFAKALSGWQHCLDLCDLWSLKLIIIEFLAINWVMISEDGVTVANLRAILDTNFIDLFSCMVAFWFGNKTFGKWKT